MPEEVTTDAWRLFLSYSGRDAAFASDLHERAHNLARTHGVPLRIEYAPHSIKGGEEWEAHLAAAIRESHLILVLWTSETPSAKWQLIEIGAAWILDKKFLVVLRNESSHDLPSMLSRTQIILWERFPSEFVQFLKAIKRRSIPSLSQQQHEQDRA